MVGLDPDPPEGERAAGWALRGLGLGLGLGLDAETLVLALAAQRGGSRGAGAGLEAKREAMGVDVGGGCGAGKLWPWPWLGRGGLAVCGAGGAAADAGAGAAYPDAEDGGGTRPGLGGDVRGRAELCVKGCGGRLSAPMASDGGAAGAYSGCVRAGDAIGRVYDAAYAPAPACGETSWPGWNEEGGGGGRELVGVELGWPGW